MSNFESLPWHDDHAGTPRRVGVEMEFAGIDPERIAAEVVDAVGGQFEAESAFSGTVRDTEFGDFRIELDVQLLSSRRYLDSLKAVGIEIEPGQLRDNLEDVISRVAGLVVPHELVCPPVEVAALDRIDEIRRGLCRAGAKGTGSSALYAFGLQFNIDIAERSGPHLVSVLRAFFLLFEEICEREQIDFSRKLTPFVQRFPEDFVAHVLEPDYAPDLETLIDDYLAYTPTRNRPLDMLPLFAWIDRERVMAAPVERDLIKPRPVWHYRLPNCLIDDPDWSLCDSWGEWVRVETLAADSDALAAAARKRLGKSSTLRRWWSKFWRDTAHRAAKPSGRD